MNKRSSNPFQFNLVLVMALWVLSFNIYQQKLFASPNYNPADFTALGPTDAPIDINPGCATGCWKITPKSTNPGPVLIPLRCQAFESFIASLTDTTPLIVPYKPYHVVDASGAAILDSVTLLPVIFQNPVPRSSAYATKSACTTPGTGGGPTIPHVTPNSPCDPSDPAGLCYYPPYAPFPQPEGCNGGGCSS